MAIRMEKQDNGITEGVIWKQLLMFFFPILIGIFFQQLYNTVDTVIVGRFVGKEALSSVGGSSSQIINLVIGFFTGISTGASVLVAQYYGAKDENGVYQTLHTSYAFAILGGLVFGVLGIWLAPDILRWMNTPEELMAESTQYVRIYSAGMVFVFVYNMGAAILRAVGDSKRPLYLLIICCGINIVLDFVFVLGFESGVAGVGYATLLSQAISAILVTLLIMYRTKELKLELNKLCLKPDFLKKLLWIGLPTGIESAMYSISNVIIQAALNDFGVDTVAAWAAFGKIDGFFWMINNAFGTAIVTFVGQNFGAGKPQRIRKAVQIWLMIAVAAAFTISGLILVNDRFLLGFFTSDSAVIDIGVRMVWSIAPYFFLFEFIEILSGALRAEGFVMVSTLMVFCGTCLFRIVWVLFIAAGKSLEMILYCFPITWSIGAVMFIVYYWWKQKRVFKITHSSFYILIFN